MKASLMAFALFSIITVLTGCNKTNQVSSATKPEPPTSVAFSSTSEKSTNSWAKTSSLTWKEQQQTWDRWLKDIKVAVKFGSASDRMIYAFLKENGALIDANKGTPARSQGKQFHVLVVNGDISQATPWEQELGQSEYVFAGYHYDLSALVVKKTADSFPRKVRGTIGFHEAIHAYRDRMQLRIENVLTVQDHAAEELVAWEPQCRLFRKLYSPSYEPFRQKLVQMMLDDIKARQQQPQSEEENFIANLPSLNATMRVMDNPAEIVKAFEMPSNSTADDMFILLNFAFMDCAFEVLDKNFPDPKQAQVMKVAFFGYINEQAGF